MSEIASKQVVAELAPTGTLRAGINMGNMLLVTGRTETGDPAGVAPDMAAEIAKRLGVPVAYVKYEKPSLLADAAGTGAWDIGLIGAEPARAEKIAFTAAYCEIEATYLVPENSPFKSAAEVDRAGARISVKRGTAYDLWLARNIKHATVLRTDAPDGPLNQFVADKLEAMASLRPALLEDVKKVPGTKILPGNFTAVQQAIGTTKQNTAGAAFLSSFVEEAKSSGLVARLIERHHVQGLSVAP
ncbi:MAG TPA: transporter substrate-binding domain-containing protein [Xanthobacteraceae bacterium]|nr:transporter substrate-binding domain-containing protein [Xanthobacteraceae bacterium]